MASFGVKVMRGVFGAAEYVAPKFVARVAFELFCRTPNPRALSPGEKRAVARAEDFMAEARHHRLHTPSGCVAVHEFRPAQGRWTEGTVLIVHGWRSRTEYMKALIERYRDAGYRVMSLDLPGHGASPGRRLTMVSAVEAVATVGQWFGPFEAVVGHSFGGAVAANAVAGSVERIAPLQAGKLVLIAAPSSMPEIFQDFGRFLNLGPRSQQAIAVQVKRISGRDLDSFTGSRQLAGIRVPTLVIHAPDDREVPRFHAELYAEAGDHVRLHWAPGLGHRRILSDPGTVEEAVGFVLAERRSAALSGPSSSMTGRA